MKALGWLLAGGFLIGAAGTASAQDAKAGAGDSSSSRITSAFAACQKIAAAETRLQCYDKAAAEMAAAIASKEVRIIDRTDVRKARRSLFGFALPRLRIFGVGDDADNGEEEFTEINSSVASSRAVANDRYELRLADESGAVWQTTDPMGFPPKNGAAIRIRKGAMGNYFLTVDGRSYRGMRVR